MKKIVYIVFLLTMCTVARAQWPAVCGVQQALLLQTDTVQIKAINHHLAAGMVLVTIDTCGNAVWAKLTGNQSFYDSTGNTLLVNGGSNVGLGVAIPLAKFEVVGTTLDTGVTAFGRPFSYGVNTMNGHTAFYAEVNGVRGASLIIGSDITNTTTSEDSVIGLYAARMTFNAKDTIFSKSPFITNQVTGSDSINCNRFSVIAGTTAITGGKVGVGTLSPSVLLDVEGGSTSPSFKLVDGTQGTNKVLTSDGSGNGSWNATIFTALDSVSIYALTPTAGTVYYCNNCTGNGFTGHNVSYLASAWRRITGW